MGAENNTTTNEDKISAGRREEGLYDYGYLILNGGKSLRMNRKNKIKLEINGVSQLERLKNLIKYTERSLSDNPSEHSKDMFISCAKGKSMNDSDKKLYYSEGFSVIEDIRENCGPMGGIFSALILSNRRALVVMSSDLYTEDKESLLPLLESFRDTGLPVFYTTKAGSAEPIPGIYTKDMLCDIRAFIEAGEFSLGRMIRAYSRKNDVILTDSCKGGVFRNLNTPEDAAEAGAGNETKRERSAGLEEAFERLKTEFSACTMGINDESVELYEAAGRYLAEDIRAAMSQPPFDRSPLDGYALRSEDIACASEDTPAVLKVTEKSYAGDRRRLNIGKGEAVRIMTGAPVPAGADTVVMQEQTDCGEGFTDENGKYIAGSVKIFTDSEAGKNIVRAGEDFSEGELLLRKGEKLEAAGAALLASAGIVSLRTSRKIRISLFSTGDELTKPGYPLEHGRIYDSNLYGARALFKLCGETVVRAEQLSDDEEVIAEKINMALMDSDIIITTGGVSVGQRDVMPRVLELIQAKIVFSGLDLKPGMPTRCAECAGKAIFCLSGNPAAAYTHMELIIKPFLRYLHGSRERDPWGRQKAILLADIKKKSPKRRLVRGFFANGAVSFPEGCFSSGSLCGLERSNCFIDIPEGSSGLDKGCIVDILPFDSYNSPKNRVSRSGKRDNEKPDPFIYAVSGYKNTGKTRLINKLIPKLSGRGLKIACIKHDAHGFEPDVPGTDSCSFRLSGAAGCGIFSPGRYMITKDVSCDEKFLISAFPEADIILIEGLKDSGYPKYFCRYPEAEADDEAVFEEIMKLYEEYVRES